MILLTIEKMKKTFGAQTLFKDVTLGISQGEKIGLLGLNGTGKSTLLKIISGDESVDDGKITKARGVRISHLLQDPEYDEDLTVIDQAMAFLRQGDVDISEYEVKTMLNHLDILDHERVMKTLSGGQKKRVALCATLLIPSDLLILDEPTNHMDNETIDWLEHYLKRMKCAVVMVTHDRYFLDRIVQKIFEISDQSVSTYEGKYQTYLERKSERLSQQQTAAKKMKNLYVRELAWIRAGVQARSTKSKSRIQRFEALQSEMTQITDENILIESAFTRLGKKIMEIDHLVYGYESPLNQAFSYIAVPNDRIGIIGKNGAGKSTLLNTLAGEKAPRSGTIELGTTVRLGYFTQNPELHADPDQRAIDYIKEVATFITNKEGYRISASDLMEQFLFDSALQYTSIGALSGGERRRLQLLKVLIDSPNVLLLDEPTNNLDLDTLKALEGYLDTFEGIVLCVSHDRYFLDRVCDKLFVLADGNLSIQAGNYSDYLERVQNGEESSSLTNTSGTSSSPMVSKEKTARTKSVKKKLSFKESQALETLPRQIEKMELRLEAIEGEMVKFASDFAKIQTLFEEKESLELEYLSALETYEDLLALKESFES